MLNNKGQSLFEVVIAMALISLVLISIVSLASLSIKASVFAKNQAIAIRLSQQASEWLQGEKTANWPTFNGHLSTSTNWCLDSLTWNNTGTCTQNEVVPGTIFVRNLTLSGNPDGTITADIVTTWTDSQGQHSTPISNIFGDIR